MVTARDGQCATRSKISLITSSVAGESAKETAISIRTATAGMKCSSAFRAPRTGRTTAINQRIALISAYPRQR